jgi:sulfate/thiosulfate transport system ATP-binding protein
VADRIVVMGNGKIEQIGTPEQIYNEPANSFVFDFVGESVKLPVTVSNGAIWIGSRQLPSNGYLLKTGPAQLFIRPHDLAFSEAGDAPLQGAVQAVRRIGAASIADVRLEIGGQNLFVEAAIPPGANVRAGERVGLTPRRYRLFEQANGAVTLN